MKVLILEDEKLAGERLTALLKAYDPGIVVLDTIDSVDDALHWLKNNDAPDCILLDIQLSDGICFEIFKKINITCPVIFTTAYDQYAIDAFKLFSIDYLLKPITFEKLAMALNKLKNIHLNQWIPYRQLVEQIYNLKDNYKSRFLIKVGVKMYFIKAEDIAYIYADDKTSFIMTAEGNRFMIDYSLDTVEKQHNPRLFYRLNRQVISKIDAIKDVKQYTNRRLKIILKAGTEPYETIVSRERVAEFKNWAES
jgi:two-component system response regulator LytT